MRPMERDNTLWQIVLTKYPKTVAEFRCKNEKKMMDLLRERYYNQLINNKNQKDEQNTC
jgi:hypothetical protein